MLFSICEKNDGDTLSCKVMFNLTYEKKYFEKRTCLEEYSSGFIRIMKKFHTVVSQHSKPCLQFADSMLTGEIPLIKS
jgi:hypothetical protein